MDVPHWMASLPTQDIFPEFYHYIGKSKNDKLWLDKKLSRLSRSNRISACLAYRQWYLSKGRNEANQRLSEFVSEYGLSLREAQRARIQHINDPKGLFLKLEKLKEMKPLARSKYGEIF